MIKIPLVELDNFSEEDAKKICQWKYPQPWDVYNMPSWDEIVQNNWDMANTDKRKREYIAFRFEGNLQGYGRIFRAGKYTMLGIGLDPLKCGIGYGSAWMPQLIKLAKLRYPDQQIALEVRTFNLRAIRCYQSLDFRIVGIYNRKTYTGLDHFYLMKLFEEPT